MFRFIGTLLVGLLAYAFIFGAVSRASEVLGLLWALGAPVLGFAWAKRNRSLMGISPGGVIGDPGGFSVLDLNDPALDGAGWGEGIGDLGGDFGGGGGGGE